eukprot:354292-Chlamydomonas_euryale.AAC.5
MLGALLLGFSMDELAPPPVMDPRFAAASAASGLSSSLTLLGTWCSPCKCRLECRPMGRDTASSRACRQGFTDRELHTPAAVRHRPGEAAQPRERQYHRGRGSPTAREAVKMREGHHNRFPGLG